MTSLKLHLRLKYVGELHQCEICDKLFKNKSVMVVHKRAHFDCRPYECENCGEQFSCTSQLKSHYLQHKQQNLELYNSFIKNLLNESNLNSGNKFGRKYAGELFYSL